MRFSSFWAMNATMPQRTRFKKAIAFQKDFCIHLNGGVRTSTQRWIAVCKYQKLNRKLKVVQSHADKPLEKVNKKERKKSAQQSQTLLNGITHIRMTNTMTFMRVLSTQCYHHFSALIHRILLPFQLQSRKKTIFLFVFTYSIHISDKNRIRSFCVALSEQLVFVWQTFSKFKQMKWQISYHI